MSKQILATLLRKTAHSQTEEEIRLAWVSTFEQALKIQIHAERARNDASYNQVVVEFKKKGLFNGKENSAAFREAIYDRLERYIPAKALLEGLDPSSYIGIATDGIHIAFAFHQGGHIRHGHLMPVNATTVEHVVRAFRDSSRRAVTAENLKEDFGHDSEIGRAVMSALATALSKSLRARRPDKIRMLFEEWQALYGQVADLSVEQVRGTLALVGFTVAVPEALSIPATLFIIHSYDSLVMKLLGAEIVGALTTSTAYLGFAEAAMTLDDTALRTRLRAEIEDGAFYSRGGINGFVEEAIFSWYLDACNASTSACKQICAALRNLLSGFALYRTDDLESARSRDVLKTFYQDLVPDVLRKSLGEFYTPDWLVDVTIEKLGVNNWLLPRFLDPTCGSGSFLLSLVKRIRAAAEAAGWTPAETIAHITENVWGFDLNPLAVQAARVNLLIAISDLLANVPGTQLELPVLLADAVYSPARNPVVGEDVVDYVIGSSVANLKVSIPSTFAYDRQRLDEVFKAMAALVEANQEGPEAMQALVVQGLLSDDEARRWERPLQATYERVLDLHRRNWNGIWFRIVRNFFWSATAGRFDVVIGNPPWVRWSKLPELYRERVKPTCQQYDIFSATPRHGGNELDISAMISYTVSDKWLKEGGTLAFLVTQTLFQTPSSVGFRRFKIDEQHQLVPVSVDDLKALKPFPDAANKTAIFIARKSATNVATYPLPYNVWTANPGETKTMSANLTMAAALAKVSVERQEASPVGELGSPWSILPVGDFAILGSLPGASDWAVGRKGVTADINGLYFVEVLRQHPTNGLVQIRTRPEAGKTNIGPSQMFWVEPDLLYPLAKGASDFSACHWHPKHQLHVLVPNRGITRAEYLAAAGVVAALPKTKAYLDAFKPMLNKRSTYRLQMEPQGAPFYSVYNVGDYTFAPFKVVWAEQKAFCAVVVADATGAGGAPKVIVPDHKLFFVAFQDEAAAMFLCGLLNMKAVKTYVESHIVNTQRGNVFKHLRLPEFDAARAAHRDFAELVKKAHEAPTDAARATLLGKIAVAGALLI